MTRNVRKWMKGAFPKDDTMETSEDVSILKVMPKCLKPRKIPALQVDSECSDPSYSTVFGLRNDFRSVPRQTGAALALSFISSLLLLSLGDEKCDPAWEEPGGNLCRGRSVGHPSHPRLRT